MKRTQKSCFEEANSDSEEVDIPQKKDNAFQAEEKNEMGHKSGETAYEMQDIPEFLHHVNDLQQNNHLNRKTLAAAIGYLRNTFTFFADQKPENLLMMYKDRLPNWGPITKYGLHVDFDLSSKFMDSNSRCLFNQARSAMDSGNQTMNGEQMGVRKPSDNVVKGRQQPSNVENNLALNGVSEPLHKRYVNGGSSMDNVLPIEMQGCRDKTVSRIQKGTEAVHTQKEASPEETSNMLGVQQIHAMLPVGSKRKPENTIVYKEHTRNTKLKTTSGPNECSEECVGLVPTWSDVKKWPLHTKNLKVSSSERNSEAFFISSKDYLPFMSYPNAPCTDLSMDLALARIEKWCSLSEPKESVSVYSSLFLSSKLMQKSPYDQLGRFSKLLKKEPNPTKSEWLCFPMYLSPEGDCDLGHYVLIAIRGFATITQILMEELSKTAPFEHEFDLSSSLEKGVYFFIIDSLKRSMSSDVYESILISIETLFLYVVTVTDKERNSRSKNPRYSSVQASTKQAFQHLRKFYMERSLFIIGPSQGGGTLSCGLFVIAHISKALTKGYLKGIADHCYSKLKDRYPFPSDDKDGNTVLTTVIIKDIFPLSFPNEIARQIALDISKSFPGEK